ncbi:aspartate/glutamate racemase family protein, partial [Patescibacteria group bacterium]|nr:aspartate/glutamate racemase family protein [Patescibacteria group bacterium]
MNQEKQIPDMKTMGVIGGLGPQATMDVVARLHKVSQKLIPQFVNRGYPPILVGYFRDAPMVLREDGSVPDELQPDPRLLELARTLGLHVDFLIIASNTPHFFVREIEEASGRKVLSIVDAVLEDVQRRRCSKVGVLAIGETLQHRLYQDR